MKKLVVLLLIVTLAIAFAVPALASSTPTATAKLDKTLVNIEVKDGSVTFFGTGTYNDKTDKNKTVTYPVVVSPTVTYYVAVEFSGNGVKSARVVAPFPNNGGSQGGAVANTFYDREAGERYTNSDYNNANFHCNTLGGNGRVWLTMGKDMSQKWSAPLNFVKVIDEPISNQANRETAWKLMHQKVFICEVCGSDEWVSFSNNSGKPDGKNIQLNHPLVNLIIDKEWIMLAGDKATSSARFDLTLLNGRVVTLGTGRHALPPGDYKLVEKAIANFKLVKITVDGEEVDIVNNGTTVILEKKDVRVKFTNKEDPYGMIIKTWDDENPNSIVARFDIYGTAGNLVRANAEAGVKYYLPIGEYVAVEQPKPGYVEHPVVEFEIKDGVVAIIEFHNERLTFDGKFAVIKTVEGIKLVDFTVENDIDIMDLISGISFGLYKAILDEDGNPIGYEEEVIVPGDLNLAGIIEFDWKLDQSLNGWYAVVETYAPLSLAEEIFDSADPLFIFLQDDVVTRTNGFNYNDIWVGLQQDGVVLSVEFDVAEGYEGWPEFDPGYQYFPVNPWFGNFAVVSEETGEVIASYCAYWYSGMLGLELTDFSDVRFVGAEGAAIKANIVSAFNYINTMWGSLDTWPTPGETTPQSATKMIAQVVLWALLEDGVIDPKVISPGFEFINDYVDDVLTNHKTSGTIGTLVDVVFLAREGYVFDNGEFIRAYQPQMIIVELTFDNKLKGGVDGSVSFMKTVYGEPAGADDFVFELFKKVDGEWESQGTYPTNLAGVVEVDELTPGEYKFVEVYSFFWDEPFEGNEGAYNLIWRAIYPKGADALYFIITSEGKTEWRDADVEIPIIDNVAACKHAMFWNDLETFYSSLPHDAIRFKDGWLIIFHDWCQGNFDADPQPARCGVPGITWLTCTDCGMGTSIQTAPALECDFQPTGYFDGSGLNEWYTCTHCGANELRPIEVEPALAIAPFKFDEEEDEEPEEEGKEPEGEGGEPEEEGEEPEEE